MKLFLASQAKNPKSLKEFKKFVGKDFKDLSIAYIPTAANGEFYNSWKASESLKVASKLCKNLNIVQLENICYKDVLSELKDVDIIWMAGGMSGYLLYWIYRSELDKILPDILNKGTTYIGSSAGSMICAPTQYSAEWFIGEEEPGASLLPGLGLIDFEIYPHFEDKLKPKIEKKWKEGKLCLLKDGEAVVVDGDKVKIFGEERFIEK